MPRVQSPVGPREDFYDRNITTLVGGLGQTISEGQGQSEEFRYTVPADRKALVTYMSVGATPQIAADTTDANDVVGSTVKRGDGDGNDQVVMEVMLPSAAYTLQDTIFSAAGSYATLDAGEELAGETRFEGTSMGAGRVRAHIATFITEFDR